MKELSIEEKAQRFDESLKAAVVAHKDEDKHLKATLERIFPELKESEDERIWIINYLSNRILNSTIIAEKENLKKAIAWLEKQGEQKPAEWSEIDKANLEDSIYFVKEFRRSNLCDNESRLQNSRTCIEWLASLKDRVQPQPKQEWSEEDRKIIIELVGIFESAIDGGYVDIPYRLIKDYIRVLKSCLLQTTWKPSEEQMIFLWKYAEQNNYDGRILSSLYDDLKKL